MSAASIGALLSSAARAEFIHPGIAHSQASIDTVKSKIVAGEEPWAKAWTELKDSRDADLTRTPEPSAHVERGAYNKPNIGSSEFSGDSSAAYAHALCWALSGDERHAKKATHSLPNTSQEQLRLCLPILRRANFTPSHSRVVSRTYNR